MKIALIIAVFLSIISQHPILLESGVSTILKLSWILPFVLCITSGKKDRIFPVFSTEILTFFIFFLYTISCEIILNQRYITADHMNIAMSLFICIVSYKCWLNSDMRDSLNLLVIATLSATLIVSFFVYVTYGLVDAINTTTYAYTAKNSLSTIVLSAAIISFMLSDSNYRFKYVIWIVASLLIIFMFVLKSRATILGFFFFIIYIAKKIDSKPAKTLLILFTITVCIIIFFNESLYESVINGIILANNDKSDINSVSSGRIELITKAMDIFSNHMILGIGEFYVDNMPLVMLVQYGILGACLVFYYIFVIVKKTISFNSTKINSCTCALLGVYLINSLFEAQPPFGPGAKCFLLWVFIGFSYAEHEMSEHYESWSNVH